nr:uncharacterized protein LOC129523551 [Gorilla gorilla gorilla]XP_055225130.1 uncharacterized protein LOC129523551 [Gorilla gorilla gorilla]
MAAAAAAPDPKPSLRAFRWAGRQRNPARPFSSLRLLAEGVTYPTRLTAAARKPHSPPRTRNTRARRRGGGSCSEQERRFQSPDLEEISLEIEQSCAWIPPH